MVVETIPERSLVRVAPLTTKGDRYNDTLPVPQDVAKKAALSHPTAIVIAETNLFTWLGYDLRPLHRTNDIYIGRMPPGFTAKVMTLVKDAKTLNRD